MGCEFGADLEAWVLTYRPPLGATALARALAATPGSGFERPDLSRRGWPAVGAGHAAAFARARDVARRGARRRKRRSQATEVGS